jgi:hypothetical protein
MVFRALGRATLRAVEGPITFARKAEAMPEPELWSNSYRNISKAHSETDREILHIPNLQTYRRPRTPQLLRILLERIKKYE